MTRREAAIIECYTGYETLKNNRQCVYQYAEEVLKRERTPLELFREDIRHELRKASESDFKALFEDID